MRFDVKPIARASGESMAVAFTVTPADLGLDLPEVTFDPDVQIGFSGTVQNTGDGVLVLYGEAKTAYTVACARCLKPVRKELSVPVNEVFRPDRPTHMDVDEEPEEDEEAYSYRGFRIDPGDAVRDNLLAVLPMRELCREDCAGICPVCGADRNTNPCTCVDGTDEEGGDGPGRSGSPFDKLKELL